jgi:hypothetical protein
MRLYLRAKLCVCLALWLSACAAASAQGAFCI